MLPTGITFYTKLSQTVGRPSRNNSSGWWRNLWSSRYQMSIQNVGSSAEGEVPKNIHLQSRWAHKTLQNGCELGRHITGCFQFQPLMKRRDILCLLKFRSELNVLAMNGTRTEQDRGDGASTSRMQLGSGCSCMKTRPYYSSAVGSPVVFKLGHALGRTRKHLTSIKPKHRKRLNLEPALIFALTKIRPRTEVLACQKQAQSSH
jgi:hypothetical protein